MKKREHYFVVKKGETHGIDYDKYKHPEGKKLLADSLLNGEWVARNNIYKAFLDFNASLVSVKENKDSGTVNEHYQFKDKDSLIVSSYYLTYSKYLKDVEASISTQLDSIRNMKLIYAKMNSPRREINKSGYIVDAMEIFISLRQFFPEKEDEAIKHINRYLKKS